jgi:hypothetical protein
MMRLPRARARVEAKSKLDGVVDMIEYKRKVERMRADTTYTTQRPWRYFSSASRSLSPDYFAITVAARFTQSEQFSKVMMASL